MLLIEELVYTKNRLIQLILVTALLTLFATLLLTLQHAFAEKQTLHDSENPPLTREEVDIFCDASEDYEENKEQCDKLYDMVKDDDDDDDDED
jgi:hypothetical protein